MDVYGEVTISVQDALNQWINQHCERTGQNKAEVNIKAGTALIILGCSIIGTTLGITDPDIGLQPGYECLAKFQELEKKLK